MTQIRLLPHLAAACKQAREEAGIGPAKVAGEVPYGASTSISRTFERAQAWPNDPDAVVSAYSRTTSVPPFDLWQDAIDRAREAEAGLRRAIGPTAPTAGEGDEMEQAAKKDSTAAEDEDAPGAGEATGS